VPSPLDPLSHVVPAGAAASVWMGALDGTGWLSRDSEREYPAASTMKLPVLVALHAEAAAGRLDLDASVPVSAVTPSVVPGAQVTVTQDYDNDDQPWNRLGEGATLRWLSERAIVRSSNLATNLLLQHVGLTAVAQVLASAGATHSHVRRGIQDSASSQMAPHAGNVVTAADLAALLRALGSGRLLPQSATEEVLRLLSRVEDNDAIPAGLPAGTWCAHKPGWIEGVCHDAALIRHLGEPPVVLVILTRADLAEDAAFALVADLTRACWDARTALASSA
jgi:beta-lactamase class A